MSGLLSVIVPVYNTERFLPRCLDSIAGQTYRNLEIILVDDGSTDGSGRICDEYAVRDGRVRVIHKENGGAGSARNAGLDAASGVWVTFVDSDDWIDSGTYEAVMSVAEKHGVDLVQWDRRSFTDGREGRQRSRGKSTEFGAETLASFFDASMCVKMVRVSRIAGVRFSTGTALSEDRLFSAQTYFACPKCFHISRAFYHYRMRESSATHSVMPEMVMQEVGVVRQMEDLYSGSPIDFSDFIYSQKREIKIHALIMPEKPDLQLCRSVFPEIDGRLSGERSCFGLLYFLIRKNLHSAACILVRLWILFFGT